MLNQSQFCQGLWCDKLRMMGLLSGVCRYVHMPIFICFDRAHELPDGEMEFLLHIPCLHVVHLAVKFV